MNNLYILCSMIWIVVITMFNLFEITAFQMKNVRVIENTNSCIYVDVYVLFVFVIYLLMIANLLYSEELKCLRE